MQNNSLDMNSSGVKNFFKKLCIVSNRYYAKEQFVSNLDTSSENLTEVELRKRIHQLGEELYEMRKERDKALVENKNRINQLNDALVSAKTTMKELLQDKKKRVRQLEKRIKKVVGKSSVPTH